MDPGGCVGRGMYLFMDIHSFIYFLGGKYISQNSFIPDTAVGKIVAVAQKVCMYTHIHTHMYIYQPTKQRTPNHHHTPNTHKPNQTKPNKALEFRAQQEKTLGHTHDGCKHAQAKKLGAVFGGASDFCVEGSLVMSVFVL